MKKISVLVCDDSALMRRSLRKIIESSKDLEVIDTARDGEDAITKAMNLRPDVITMDINMPGIDGITALQHIMKHGIAPVIMISSLTQEGAEATFQAIALGAFDYVSKPGGTVSVNINAVANEIIHKIKAAGRQGTLKRLLRKTKCRATTEKANHPSKNLAITNRASSTIYNAKLPSFKAVAIGVSTGGPKILFDVLPFLPKDLNAAVFLVQHMPPKFVTSFAERIDSHCALKCVEAQAGMEVNPGTIYIGKGGYHLTLHQKVSKKIVIRTSSKPEHTFMPSVDIMMESVLSVFGRHTIGVLLTGMGDDGADSMVKISQAGCPTIAESKESAIVFGMPNEAIKRGGAKVVKPIWDIAQEIIKVV